MLKNRMISIQAAQKGEEQFSTDTFQGKCKQALTQVIDILALIEDSQVRSICQAIMKCNKAICYGVGREGLCMKSLAMRLYHLGFNASVVGDMNCPPVGLDDVLLLSAGPGYFSTVSAIAEISKK